MGGNKEKFLAQCTNIEHKCCEIPTTKERNQDKKLIFYFGTKS